MKREKICNIIQNRLLKLEKYNQNNVTYFIVPKNHPVYPFPYNIHDRYKYKLNELKNILTKHNKLNSVKLNLEKNKNNNVIVSYNIKFKNNKNIEDLVSHFKKLNFKLKSGYWICTID